MEYSEHLQKKKQEIEMLLVCARSNGRLNMASIMEEQARDRVVAPLHKK
jgi:hypothetical protein